MSTQFPAVVGYLNTPDFTPIGSPYGVNQQPAAGSVAAPVSTFVYAPDSYSAGLKKSISFVVNYTDIAALSSATLGPVFPKYSRVTHAYYEVLTTFTSATDAATIGMGFATDDVNGVLASIAISDGTNPFDAGCKACIQDGAVANFSNRLTADRQLQFTRGGAEVLTAGKLVVYLDYTESVAP